jgi:hypothetical protein
MSLLCDLVTTNRDLLLKNEEIMARKGDLGDLKKEGYMIYSVRLTLRECFAFPAIPRVFCWEFWDSLSF